MLNRPCFLLNSWTEIGAMENLSAQSIALFVVKNTPEALKELFHLIYANDNLRKGRKFSICFDLTAPLENTNISEIGSLLCNVVFHASFYNAYNSPHFFYIKSEDEETTSANLVLGKLSELLRLQFFSAPLFFEIKQNQGSNDGSVDELLELGDEQAIKPAGSYYLKHFLQYGYYNRHIYIKSLNPRWLGVVEKELINVEQRYAELNGVLFKQATALKNSSEENKSLQYKLHLCNEKVNNYKQYLDIIHVADEAGRINEFYHHEYEVLPLWYKRFGHVIKVVLGKRALGSLFSDKGKKLKRNN